MLLMVAFGGMAVDASAHSQLHRGCTTSLLSRYYVGVGHVSCDFAKRWARTQIRGGRGPSGWRCPRDDPGRNFGTCKRDGKIFHWAPSGA